MNPDILRADIEHALDDLVAHEEGMRFQSLAVILGKLRWPELVASERRWDQGRDAYVPASQAPDGKGKALASSLTASLAKLKADAAEISKHVTDVSLLIFVTPASISNHTIEDWAEQIRDAFGYDLFVLQREEIISQLLLPTNASLCRSLLRLSVAIAPSVADMFERARTACSAEVAAWAAHPRLVGKPRIPLRAVRLDDRGGETSETMDVPAIRDLLIQGRRLILEAPAGRGKTTTLIDLAETQSSAESLGLSFLVDFPAWVHSHQQILEFLIGKRSFLAQTVTAAELAVLSQSVQCLFLLNGWNEVPEQYSMDAITALRDLERSFPGAGIVIATRTHHVPPPLPGASRLQLLPLTRAQRTAYLDAVLGQESAELGTQLDRDDVLDELTRTPFILAEVVTLFRAHTPIPRTTPGVLAAVVRVVEAADEHRAQLQGPPLSGNARDFLTALAVAMTARGGVTLSESDARSVVSSEGRNLRDAGQVATIPAPASVLGALTAHHILERVDSGTPLFRFQHQQFQAFFTASKLAHELLGIRSADTAAMKRFTADYLNWPIWEDALHLVAEELSAPGDLIGAPAVLTLGQMLIDGAAAVDLVFAATLARRCGEVVWQGVRQIFGERVPAWYRVNDPHHQRCALAAMVATESPDFTDVLLPLLTSPDRQTRVQIYRAPGEFRISSLGFEWRRVISDWSEECRVDLAQHVSAEIAEDLARTDSSRAVRLAALDNLTFLGEDASVAQVLEHADAGTFEEAIERRGGLELPTALHGRARDTYRAMLGRRSQPLERLRILVAAAHVGDPDALADARGVLASLPSEPLPDNATYLIQAALAEIRRADPAWVSDWVAGRIFDSGLWRPEWTAMIDSLSTARQDDLLQTVVSGDKSQSYRARTVLVQMASRDLAARAFRKLCELRRSPADRTVAEAKWQLRDLFRDLPTRLVAAGVAQSLTSVFDSVEHADVVDIFMGTHATERHLRDDVANGDRQKLCAYLKSGVDFVLRQDDFSGTLKMHLAAALGRVGDPDDMPEISRLIQADLVRLRTARAALFAGERSERTNGATMHCANWYVAAVATLDPARGEDVLLGLLGESEYENDVAGALVRLALKERREAVPNLFRGIDYGAVSKARAGADDGRFDPARRSRYAAALKQRIATILGEAEASSDPNSYNHRLKQLAIHLATLDGAASGAMVLEIAVRPCPYDDWTRTATVEALLVAGARLPLEATLAVLEPVIADATDRARYDQQVRHLLNRCLCLLPFVDPPDAGIARLQEILAGTPLHGYELTPLLQSLGHSRSSHALPVLVDIARNSTGSLHASDWVAAVVALGTAEARQLLFSAIDPEAGPAELPAFNDVYVRQSLADALAKIVSERPEEKPRILRLCDQSLDASRRDLLAEVIAVFGERDVVLRGLHLVSDARPSPVPGGIWCAIERVAVERRPAGSQWYSLVPASAQDIRRRLFDMALHDPARRRSAFSLLGQIEEWRLEYGRPSTEPRHPDIDSGAAWPPLESETPAGA